MRNTWISESMLPNDLTVMFDSFKQMHFPIYINVFEYVGHSFSSFIGLIGSPLVHSVLWYIIMQIGFMIVFLNEIEMCLSWAAQVFSKRPPNNIYIYTSSFDNKWKQFTFGNPQRCPLFWVVLIVIYAGMWRVLRIRNSLHLDPRMQMLLFIYFRWMFPTKRKSIDTDLTIQHNWMRITCILGCSLEKI
jgi:hypothetical protein